MRFLLGCVLMLGLMVLSIAGCGGGGGGGGGDGSTKTATLKLSTQSSVNPAALIGGFDLKITLPSVASLPVDASNTPLPSAVFSSGQFAGVNFSPGSSYFSASHELTVVYGSANSYALGEFITIVMTVPTSYDPNQNDIVNSINFRAGEPGIGNTVPGVTAIIKSFN